MEKKIPNTKKNIQIFKCVCCDKSLTKSTKKIVCSTCDKDPYKTITKNNAIKIFNITQLDVSNGKIRSYKVENSKNSNIKYILSDVEEYFEKQLTYNDILNLKEFEKQEQRQMKFTRKKQITNFIDKYIESYYDPEINMIKHKYINSKTLTFEEAKNEITQIDNENKIMLKKQEIFLKNITNIVLDILSSDTYWKKINQPNVLTKLKDISDKRNFNYIHFLSSIIEDNLYCDMDKHNIISDLDILIRSPIPEKICERVATFIVSYVETVETHDKNNQFQYTYHINCYEYNSSLNNSFNCNK